MDKCTLNLRLKYAGCTEVISLRCRIFTAGDKLWNERSLKLDEERFNIGVERFNIRGGEE